MQVITHQFITFGCDHGELECAGRLVFMNIGGVYIVLDKLKMQFLLVVSTELAHAKWGF